MTVEEDCKVGGQRLNLGQSGAADITNSAPEILSVEECRELALEIRQSEPDLFVKDMRNHRPHPKAPKHRIQLKDPHKSINGRNYPLAERWLNSMIDFLEEMLITGRIRPSQSHVAAGTWMIPKKDPNAMPRVVHDYRALNENTVKDHTPLPRQDDILRHGCQGTIFAKFDLPMAYYQLGMEESDIHKTAFKTPFGMFEWVVMPQGLCNAVATFQRYMNWVLRKYIGRFCHVYIDDILIWSRSREEHKRNVRLVCQALREHGLIVSSEKSVLAASSVEFLGFKISHKGLEVSQEKVDKVISSRVPRSAREIREFNGLINYIGQFIPGLSHWSTVLSRLTKKNVVFKWGPEQQEAFDNIKRLACNTPICKPINPNSTDPIMLVADASNRAIGGYIGQGKDYKTMQPAGFHSRALNSSEKNYPTHDKEMLAIVDTTKKFSQQLLGRRFEALTDHAPLVYWKTQRDLSPRQIRWNETLSQYDFDIRYIPGVSNSAADALSRYPYVQEETSALSVVAFNPAILETVRNSYKKDSFFGAVITNPEHYASIYEFDNGLIFFENRLCVPNERTVRGPLLDLYHDAKNHFGYSKTYDTIAREYFWPGLDKDVKNYIKTCDSCARNKASTHAPAGLLHSMPIPEGRLLEIALDFVGTVPKSHGYDMILGMTDRLTGYVRLEPVQSTATAEQIAKVFYSSWCRTFGLPNAITSDRDKLFTSHFWKELCKKLRIHLRMSTSFHPETDGSSERSNKTLIESLRHYVNERQTDWADHLIAVEMCMNNSKNATTGKAPTELLFGTPIRLTPPVRTSNTVPAVTDFLERIRESTAIARDNHVVAKTHQTTYANKERRPEPDYKVGDQVFLNTKNLRLRIKQKGRSAKFIARFIGPFPITKAKRKTSTYTLELPPEYKIHPTFHAKLLKPAFENDPTLFPNREVTVPPPIDVEDNQWEVQELRDHRKMRNQSQFLVRWVGYPKFPDSWIPERDINKDLVCDYRRTIETENTNELGTATRSRTRKTPGKGGVQGRRKSGSG
jgi:hypothetical protein